MTKTIYLIRHGESEANKLRIYQGQSYDTDLSKKGLKQAKLVAELLKTVKLDKIYTSPLKRTYQTANEIGKITGLSLETDKLLMEINHGKWEGKKVREFNKQEQERLRQWRKNPVGVQMPQGENIEAVKQRCSRFLKKLDEGKYVVVAHDLVIRIMVSMAIQHEDRYLWQYCLDNCGVTTISFEPLRLLSLNQNFHLKSNRSLLNRQAL